jgi:hypothetical protein
MFMFTTLDRFLIAILNHVVLVAALDFGKDLGRGLGGSLRSSLA